ncbi:hypothetical protein CEXT_40921 [Caerostris extrusa]|uniref:Uncharacterized protein n=1 Tax=Caerostris extrusa TaxID=172846 RepID=A0AAV4XSK9_CAEEX|nr:hypothetical protein CEXT_40921 [Caerostris extrusa]
MEEKIDFHLMPCLEQRALRTAAVFVWNQDDILPLTRWFSFSSFQDKDSMKMWKYRRQSKGKSLEIIITRIDERGNINFNSTPLVGKY